MLDYPALVFPVTMVDPAIDVWDEKYVAMNEQDQYNHDLCKNPSPFYLPFLCHFCGSTDVDRDPEKYRGAPVSLQLVGRRYEDEKVIKVLEYIQRSDSTTLVVNIRCSGISTAVTLFGPANLVLSLTPNIRQLRLTV